MTTFWWFIYKASMLVLEYLLTFVSLWWRFNDYSSMCC